MEIYADKNVNYKTPQEALEFLRSRFGDAVTETELREYKEGVCQYSRWHLLLTVRRERFLDLVDALGELDFPHFHVASGNDDGDTIRQTVTVTVRVPKTDLVMPSLHGRNPGVGFSEREMNEMLGVAHDGQPNTDLVFLPDGWDRTILPWRRDETGPEGKGVINELD